MPGHRVLHEIETVPCLTHSLSMGAGKKLNIAFMRERSEAFGGFPMDL